MTLKLLESEMKSVARPQHLLYSKIVVGRVLNETSREGMETLMPNDMADPTTEEEESGVQSSSSTSFKNIAIQQKIQRRRRFNSQNAAILTETTVDDQRRSSIVSTASTSSGGLRKNRRRKMKLALSDSESFSKAWDKNYEKLKKPSRSRRNLKWSETSTKTNPLILAASSLASITSSASRSSSTSGVETASSTFMSLKNPSVATSEETQASGSSGASSLCFGDEDDTASETSSECASFSRHSSCIELRIDQSPEEFLWNLEKGLSTIEKKKMTTQTEVLENRLKCMESIESEHTGTNVLTNEILLFDQMPNEQQQAYNDEELFNSFMEPNQHNELQMPTTLNLADPALKRYFQQQRKFYRQIYEQQFAAAAGAMPQIQPLHRVHTGRKNGNKLHNPANFNQHLQYNRHFQSPSYNQNGTERKNNSKRRNNQNNQHRAAQIARHKHYNYYGTLNNNFGMVPHQHLGLPPRVPQPTTDWNNGMWDFGDSGNMSSWTGEYGWFAGHAVHKTNDFDLMSAQISTNSDFIENNVIFIINCVKLTFRISKKRC